MNNAGEVDSLNDRYYKLEKQAAEVQQCEFSNLTGVMQVQRKAAAVSLAI
jgi:hypothetical protein